MISIKNRGNFRKIEKFFDRLTNTDYSHIYSKYGKKGVSALESVTPIATGKTASSWGYEITQTKRGTSITWTNTNVVNGVPIAIILQFGHATRTGGYVQGYDYINPALRPIFDSFTNDIWREVTKI